MRKGREKIMGILVDRILGCETGVDLLCAEILYPEHEGKIFLQKCKACLPKGLTLLETTEAIRNLFTLPQSENL
jgi:hypothetical protein